MDNNLIFKENLVYLRGKVFSKEKFTHYPTPPMKIREIKISNIMSFPFLTDLPNSEGIQFPASENKTDLNILIGANGSGKSNFIEIINQFVRNMVFDYTFNPALLQAEKKSDQQQAIQFIPKKTTKLSKHSRTQDQPAGVEITIELFQNDFENIGFACKYADKLNEIIEKYSKIPYRFPDTSIEDIQKNIETIHICAEFSEKEQTFIIDQSKLTPQELFALVCIQEQELLYICIRIFNQFKKDNEADNERMRYPLKNTFSVVSSERDMNERKYLNDCQEFDTYIFQQKTEKNQNFEGFYKVLHKIRTIINKNSQEILLNSDTTNIDENIENRLYNSNLWKRMTKSIKRFINKELFIEYLQGELSLKLKNDKGDRFYFSDLSAGQQSILLILFAIYGNDLRDGFMIIDEPELHTHPQLQKELAVLLNQLSEENGTQFFLSTYSALFINEENITNVYRFQNENADETHIFNPHLQIASDDAKLVHLLRYENLSKIFFVDKIILVEGDSDLYFFAHYLKWLQDQPGWEDIVGSYELININGKGSYNSWHKFLNKF
jgi:predicted ATP-dependent endonuclease of OLD family